MTTASFRVDGVLYENVTLPTCPTCGSTPSRRHLPSGWDATEWHVAREDLLAPLIGLSGRGEQQPAGPNGGR
jgi:hypothetical protein